MPHEQRGWTGAHEFAGWTGGTAVWHAVERIGVPGKVQTICGTLLPTIVVTHKKKKGPGCAKCMAWAEKNGVKP